MISATTLVTRLHDVSTGLKRAAVWNGTGLAVDATKDDYLYELLCYFHIALNTAPAFAIRVAGNVKKLNEGNLAAIWPKKPGLKKNFSYLSLRSKPGSAEVFQLCPGIRITDLHGKDRAPDVNLLAGGAPDQPSHTTLAACWDAKFTSKGAVPLPDTAVSDFIFTYLELGSPKPPASWLGSVSANECRCSGLLTNGGSSSERTTTLRAYGVSETHGFPEKPTTRP